MYYRLYRRRHQIYLAIGLILVILVFTRNSSKDNSDHAAVLNKNGVPRINMQNYVPPPQCGDCPGENGAAVYLTVRFSKILPFKRNKFNSKLSLRKRKGSTRYIKRNFSIFELVIK